MLLLGGVPFVVEPEDLLNPRERAALAKLPLAPPRTQDAGPLFRVRLVLAPPWIETAAPEPGPAQVSWEEGHLRLRHRAFLAELDVALGEARLFRRCYDSYGLEATLRAAMSGRLPREGGLPLHAAALVMRERAFVFFGPSGAGKSTLSGLWSGTVLSDELVAVTRGEGGYSVATTGFWGTLGRANTGLEAWPLGALVELAKGRDFDLQRLQATDALRRLVGVTMVPAAPPLWSEAIGAIGALLRTVPCYRMAWSVDDPPFERLTEALGL